MATTLIKTLRKERGLSQAEVAKKLDISRPTYIALEQGKREPMLGEARRAAELFDVALDDIARGRREMKTAPAPVHQKRAGRAEVRVPKGNESKFKEVLLYVLEKVGSRPNVGQTVLYKLLYFIDFDYYEKHREPVMGLEYIKNHHGPTPRQFAAVIGEMQRRGEVEEVRSKYFKYDQKKFLPLRTPDLSKLSAQELEHIDGVIARYGDKSASELSALTHEDTPWLVAREGAALNYQHAFYRPDKLSVGTY
ncbi:MAG: DUF4065 domain-containing protein, partial [bacterium]|nr:DUF4065 domain-containing protein [bacterium]